MVDGPVRDPCVSTFTVLGMIDVLCLSSLESSFSFVGQ